MIDEKILLETGWHNKTGAVFLLISSATRSLILVLVGVNTFWGLEELITWDHILHPIIDFIFGIGLWFNWRYCRYGAVFWALLIVIIVWMRGWLQGPFGFQYFSLIPQTTLLISLLLVLFGTRTRSSLVRASIVFAIGYLAFCAKMSETTIHKKLV
jgi:hypothetical protein